MPRTFYSSVPGRPSKVASLLLVFITCHMPQKQCTHKKGCQGTLSALLHHLFRDARRGCDATARRLPIDKHQTSSSKKPPSPKASEPVGHLLCASATAGCNPLPRHQVHVKHFEPLNPYAPLPLRYCNNK